MLTAPSGTRRAHVVDARFRLFAVGWAVASLFHLAGNPRPVFVEPTAGRVAVAVVLAAAALAVLCRPHDRRALLALCAAVPVSAFLEAPVVGNHWVLAAAVSATFVIATLVAPRRRADRTQAVWDVFAPAARVVLLVAYAFAAFAKLNSSFFDPSVSCAVFYQDQLVGSWGLDVLSVAGSPSLGRAAAVAAATTELAVPVLLLLRRTRQLGLLVALSFHWLLALDLHQHFWDFTSVLFATFLLFADDRTVAALGRLRSRATASVRPPLRLAVATVLASLAAVAGASAGTSPVAGLGIVLGHLGWWIWGTSVLVAVVAPIALRLLRRDWSVTSGEGGLRIAHPALGLLPLLVAANGLAPYLELKTGFSWNMYSNLRTVDGQTNHLLVPRTLPLDDTQSDLVTVLESDDPALQAVADRDYALVGREFGEYLARYPETTVTYERGGAVHRHVGSEAARLPAPNWLQDRVQAFRPVDTRPAERCVTVFSAAR